MWHLAHMLAYFLNMNCIMFVCVNTPDVTTSVTKSSKMIFNEPVDKKSATFFFEHELSKEIMSGMQVLLMVTK